MTTNRENCICDCARVLASILEAAIPARKAWDNCTMFDSDANPIYRLFELCAQYGDGRSLEKGGK